jgi:membrane protein YdbS with pleckstrin-like domain
MTDWEQERLRRQARDDAFMARIRAEHRHGMFVTLIGGGVGLVLVLVVTGIAAAIWGATVPFDVSIVFAVLGVVIMLGSVFLAHQIDRRRNRRSTS